MAQTSRYGLDHAAPERTQTDSIPFLPAFCVPVFIARVKMLTLVNYDLVSVSGLDLESRQLTRLTGALSVRVVANRK